MKTITHVKFWSTALVLGVFSAESLVASYSLGGWAACLVAAIVMAAISYELLTTIIDYDKYRDELHWEGIDIARREKLGSIEARNLHDAQEAIEILKERIIDLDDARMEAVLYCEELQEESK